jgi:hypothetical protein
LALSKYQQQRAGISVGSAPPVLPNQDQVDLKMNLERKPLPWESLSDEEWGKLWKDYGEPEIDWFVDLTEEIDKMLREKNT